VRKRLLGQLLRELSTALFHAQKLNVDGAEIALVRIDNLARRTAIASAAPQAPDGDFVQTLGHAAGRARGGLW
jgi:hypothetical protein